MPVRRNSRDDGSVRVSRKPRVPVGSSRGSEDGIRTPRSNDSGVGRGQRKTRVASEGSEGSSGGVRTGEGKKIGSRKVQSRGNGSDAVPYHSVNGRSIDTRGRGGKDWKTKSGSEGFGVVIDGKLGFKRKRISADPGRVEQEMFNGNDRNSRSPYKRNVLKSSMDDGNKLSRRKDYEFKDSSRNGKFRGSEALDRRGQNGKIGHADKSKHVRDNGLGNVKSKINNNEKAPLATQKDLNQRNNAVGSVEKRHNKKDQRMKALVNGSDLTEVPRKKKKRGIRIDPYDTSNKRLDDSISDKGQYGFSSDG